MRQLKYHEQKLLKKVDFLHWKKEKNLRELQVLHSLTGLACLARFCEQPLGGLIIQNWAHTAA